MDNVTMPRPAMPTLYRDHLRKREQKLGNMLLEAGKVSQADLDRALRIQSTEEDRLGAILVKLGLASERDIAEMIASQLSLPVRRPGIAPATGRLPLPPNSRMTGN